MTKRVFKGISGMILMLAIGIGTLNEAAAQCTVEVFATVNPGNCFSQVAIASTASEPVQSWSYYINGNIVGTNSSEIVNLEPGTYVASVVVITTQNCTAVDDFSFTVAGTQLAVDAGADVLACQESPLLSVTVSSPNPYSVQWTPANLLSNSTIASPQVTQNVTNQWFIVDVIDDVTGCIDSDTVYVTQQNPLFDTLSLCNGPVTIDLGPGAQQYNWLSFTDTAGNNISLNYPITQQTIVADEPGGYFMYADFPECGALTSSVIVEACAQCDNFFTYNTQPQQCGTWYQFVSGSSTQIVTYDWDFGDGTTSSDMNPTHLFTPGQTGVYTVTLTTTDGNQCISVSSQQIAATIGHSVVISNDTIGCQEAAYMEAFAFGGSGDFSYQWFPSTGLSNPTDSITYASGVHNQTYVCEVTDNLTGCTVGGEVTVSSYEVNMQTLNLCTGTATIDLGAGGINYYWLSFEDTLGNSSALNYSTTQQAINVQEPGTYFAYADFPNCGALTSLVTVEACPSVCTSVITSTLNYQNCGATVSLMASHSTAIDSAIWILGNGDVVFDNGNGIPPQFYSGGSYLVQLTAYHTGGCSSTTSYGLTLLTDIETEINAEDTIACAGQLFLNATTTGGGGQYVYSWPSGITTPTTVEVVTQNQWLVVDVIDTYTGCSASDSIYVYANAAINETIQLCPDSVLLTVNPGSQIYNWSYADEFGNTVQIQNFSNELFTDEIGTYICFTYYSGCNTITHSFVVEECSTQNDEVWPGDANSDGVVTNSDALYIGLAFNQTGPNRPAATLNWVGQPCPDWTFNFAQNNVNLKHADCDGNGIVNFDDTLAIAFNYLNTHNKFEAETAGGNPPIWVEASPDTVGLEQAIDIVIHIGTAAQSVDSLHGVAFSLTFDETKLSSNGLSIDYDNCVLGTAGNDVLTFQKNLFSDGTIDFAITRNTLQNFQGYGPIVHARIVTTDNLSGVHDVRFGISDVVALTASENEAELTSIPDTVIIDPTRVEIEENALATVLIYPNPATDVLNISGLEGAGTITVFNTFGQETMTVPFNNSERMKLNLSELVSGVYFVQIRTEKGIITHKLRLIQS